MHRFPLAVVSGLALWLAFPSHDLWFLAPIGVALLALATRGASPWLGALLGLVSGLSCFVPLLSWSGVYVGALPWIALAVLESLYIALLGLAWALRQRGGFRRRGNPEVPTSGTDVGRPHVVARGWGGPTPARGEA